MLGRRNDRDEGAGLGAGVELDGAFGGGEQGVVAAHADVAAGVIDGAALAHQDVAGNDGLAAELLDAEAAAFGVAAVAGRTACLFMSHSLSPISPTSVGLLLGGALRRGLRRSGFGLGLRGGFRLRRRLLLGSRSFGLRRLRRAGGLGGRLL